MPDVVTSPVAVRPSLQASFWVTGLFALVLVLIYHETTWSMISIWLRSGTFAHGFLILPISLWLVWSMQDQLRLINSKPAVWVALLIIPLGFAWLLAWLVDVLVVQQLALVAMLVVGAWAIMGHGLAGACAFPLLFLFLAVPMGEDLLVPPMMEFTATSTVWLIQQTGIPVYRENMYFSLPSGNWSVVTACSGVRYIIASVTLGLIYAFLTYRSFWRRALFVLASIIVPILANTGRAYMIVMLGHWSDMTVAVGVDHLIYGWVFFGVVMFLLFWVGSLFREDGVASSTGGQVLPANLQEESSTAFAKPLSITFLALLLAAVWPWLAYNDDGLRESGSHSIGNIQLPDAAGAWTDVDESPWQWRPDNAVAGQTAAFYMRDGQPLGLFIQYPNGSEVSGEDVVGSSSWVREKNDIMRRVDWDRLGIQLNGESVVVDKALLRGVDGELLAWSWYRMGYLYTSNDYVAKLWEVLGALGWGHAGTFRILLASPVSNSLDSTRLVMQDFLLEHGDALDEALERAMAEEP